MKKRHLNMIAIGGTIGAGFFVGSGSALTRGGPGSVFICFALIGILVFNVAHALGELAVMYPVSGGFYTYSIRFISPSWGFAVGWIYVRLLAQSISQILNSSTANYLYTGPSMASHFAFRADGLFLYCSILEPGH